MNYRDDEEIRDRLRLLARAVNIPTPKEFAQRIGVEYKNWWSIQNTGKLTLPVAQAIMISFPGVSRDWLFDGKEEGLSGRMLELLRAHKNREPQSKSHH